ncbi:MAG: hypothetical protein U0807_08715 [Candidatus Binatia bacterium]
MTARLSALLLALVAALPAQAWAGDANLDPTFGSFGVATTTIGFPNEVAVGVALQADGKIVAVGNDHEASSQTKIGVARYLPGGALDPTFGTGGTVSTSLGDDYFTQGSSVAIQPDGKILVAGATQIIGVDAFALVRYQASGSLDPTYGTGGVVITPIGTADALATDVVLDASTGGAFVTGYASDLGGTVLVLAHYDEDGDLDPAFGTGGISTLAVSAGTAGESLVRQPDGKLVVAGGAFSATFDDGAALIARFTAAGSPDGAFGGGLGFVTVDADTGIDSFDGVVVQPDGKIVATGSTYPGDYTTNGKVLLARVNASGSPDGAFGAGGIVKTDVTPINDGAGAILRLPTGQLAVGASVGISLSGQGRIALLRYNANGSLDTTFGTAGRTEVNIGTGNDFAFDLVRQADGKVILAGGAQLVGSANGTFAVMRFGGNCGNGIVNAGEECDDGNAVDGDCCSLACKAEPYGQACTDASVCTANICNGAGQCGVAAPATGCKVATLPGKAKLQFKDKPNDKSDSMLWKWLRGEATTLGNLGDPLATTSYTLCVYDESSAHPALVFETNLPAAGTCAGNPCWTSTGVGYTYRDKDATPDGATGGLFKSGAAGDAKAQVKGKGINLNMPSLPLPLPLRAQARSSGGTCFDTTFTSAGVQKNDGQQFKAKGN